MGSKNNTKQVSNDWVLLSDVVKAAKEKFPGYNYQTQLLQYYRLLVKITARKKDKTMQAHLNLLSLLMNSVENHCTGVSR